jgi:hypothetical protein
MGTTRSTGRHYDQIIGASKYNRFRELWETEGVTVEVKTQMTRNQPKVAVFSPIFSLPEGLTSLPWDYL